MHAHMISLLNLGDVPSHFNADFLNSNVCVKQHKRSVTMDILVSMAVFFYFSIMLKSCKNRLNSLSSLMTFNIKTIHIQKSGISSEQISNIEDSRSSYLLGQIKKASFSGKPTISILQHCHLLFQKTQKNLKHEMSLARILQFRFFILIALVLIFRSLVFRLPLLLNGYQMGDHYGISFTSQNYTLDLVAILLAGFIILCSFHMFFLKLPGSWIFAHLDFSKSFKDFFETLLNGHPSQNKSIFYLHFKKMTVQEMLLGVSLLKEKQEFVLTWADDKLEQEKEALEHVQECLPIIEIFGFGLAAFLFLLVPLLKTLQ